MLQLLPFMQDLVGSTVFKCLNLMIIMPASSTLSSNMRWCLKGSGAIDTRRCSFFARFRKKKRLDSKKQNHHGHLSIMFKGFKGNSSPQWPPNPRPHYLPNGSRLCNWQPILFAISCAWFTLILGACNVRQATYHDQIFEEVKHRVFFGGFSKWTLNRKRQFFRCKKNTTCSHLFN